MEGGRLADRVLVAPAEHDEVLELPFNRTAVHTDGDGDFINRVRASLEGGDDARAHARDRIDGDATHDVEVRILRHVLPADAGDALRGLPELIRERRGA